MKKIDNFSTTKIRRIEQRLRRISEAYQQHAKILHKSLTAQDSVIFNLTQATEASIDLAMHIVRTKKLGIPKQSRDAFNFLAENNIINAELAEKLGNMVGFRNIAIHEYQKLNMEIVKHIIENDLATFSTLTQKAISLLS